MELMRRVWYPKKYAKRGKRPNNQYYTRKMIMKDAFLAGFNAKQIAGYFRVTLMPVYRSLDIKELKKKVVN